jgi:catechol 2,3-dioxygenase-like lactoylglutathione lyase family enzyme
MAGRRIGEIALFARDVAATAAFYERLLGVAPDQSSPGVAVFRAGDLELLIHEVYEPGPGDLPCEDHLAVRVPGLDEMCNRLREDGVAVDDPKGYDWGRSAYLRDPDGRFVELSEDMGG